MTRAELVLGILTISSASLNIALGWKFGGKQKESNERADAITVGTNRIVDGTDRLLDRMDKIIQQSDDALAVEKLRTKEEKSHRELCEKALSEHQKQLDNLKKEVEELKKND